MELKSTSSVPSSAIFINGKKGLASYLASCAGGHHFLYRPRSYHDNEAEGHGCHCARSGGAQTPFLGNQLDRDTFFIHKI
jgi:hypothetical protein